MDLKNTPQQVVSTGNLLLVWICFSMFQASALSGDSLKMKYAMDDPRNPDCACHNYQKLAEREFKKLLKKEAAIKVSETRTTVHKSEHKFFWKRKNSLVVKHPKRRSKKAGKKALRAVACFKW